MESGQERVRALFIRSGDKNYTESGTAYWNKNDMERKRESEQHQEA
jgi:hypothetical protein